MKNILVVYNPISGAGRGQRAATLLRDALSAQGHAVEVLESVQALAKDSVWASLESVQLLVVCGGDGTLRSWFPALDGNDCAVWMCPPGNESLFARQFGMSAHAENCLSAIENWQIVHCDLAAANDSLFFTMLSVGLDAEVVRRVSSKRTKPIGDLGYALAAPGAALRFEVPALSIRVDGVSVAQNEQGYVVVANSKQFARNICFTPDADPKDALLDVCFVPHTNRTFYLKWLVPLLGGRMPSFHQARRVRGTSISISSASEPSVQVDGDFYGNLPVQISLRPKALRVLSAVNCAGSNESLG